MFFKSLKHKPRNDFENITETTTSIEKCKQTSNTSGLPNKNNMQMTDSHKKVIREDKIPASISQLPVSNATLTKIPPTVANAQEDIYDGNQDAYFEEAAEIIIGKEKASIGMIQRYLKIGFNRAARIMDQLCEYGVVGEEEGTKPRKVLMSMEQFEQLLEEI